MIGFASQSRSPDRPWCDNAPDFVRYLKQKAPERHMLYF